MKYHRIAALVFTCFVFLGVLLPKTVVLAVDAGTVGVTTNLTNATFTVSNGVNTINGSGKSWSWSDAPPGEYTVTFGNVSGYVTPAPQTQTLTPGGTITFSWGYVLAPNTILVLTNNPNAEFKVSTEMYFLGTHMSNDRWGSGKSWTWANASPGEYTVTFVNVLGYTYQTKTLTSGGTITFNEEEIYGFGTVRVMTNLRNATFTVTQTLDGDSYSYSGHGLLWILEGAAVGEYTVTFNGVSGYNTPAPQTKILTAGGTITFSGGYQLPGVTGTVRVETNLPDATFAVANGATSYSGSGQSWNWLGAPFGGYTVTFNSVSGYTTPAPQTQSLASGGTITFTGNYIKSLIPSADRHIDFDVRVDAAGFGPWMFDQDATPYSLNTNAAVYAYTEIVWNPNGTGNGGYGSGGSGQASTGNCVFEKSNVVSNIADTTIELNNYTLVL